MLDIPRRSQAIQTFRQSGGKIAAVLPVHSPRALLRAHGLLPVEVWGPPKIDPGLATAHLQPYVCSIVRNALSFYLSGGLQGIDLVVVPHACDSLQGLGSILIDFISGDSGKPAVFPLYLPRGEHGEQSFLADELRHLAAHLQELTGLAPGEEQLMSCVLREEAADRLLADLNRSRQRLPLAQSELYRLMRAREYLPAEHFSSLAQEALAQASQSGEARQMSGGIPVILSGIVPEPVELIDTLQALGGWIAADDFACLGRRIYPAGSASDPYLRMAQAILGAPPDPMRGCGLDTRLRYLVEMAQRTGARGVIFYLVKFCEPELFYLPAMRRGLQQAGLRVLAHEVDLNDGLPETTRTRLEAFLESLA